MPHGLVYNNAKKSILACSGLDRKKTEAVLTQIAFRGSLDFNEANSRSKGILLTTTSQIRTFIIGPGLSKSTCQIEHHQLLYLRAAQVPMTLHVAARQK